MTELADAKEVWIVEYKGVPQGNDKYYADEYRLENFGETNDAVTVRYIPAESAKAEAQAAGTGWDALIRTLGAELRNVVGESDWDAGKSYAFSSALAIVRKFAPPPAQEPSK